MMRPECPANRKKQRGKKTGGRRPGSKNEATPRREAVVAAGVAAIDGCEVDPRALPTLAKVMKYLLDRADEETHRKGGGYPEGYLGNVPRGPAQLRRNLPVSVTHSPRDRSDASASRARATKETSSTSRTPSGPHSKCLRFDERSATI
jgi:hypothetical protein